MGEAEGTYLEVGEKNRGGDGVSITSVLGGGAGSVGSVVSTMGGRGVGDKGGCVWSRNSSAFLVIRRSVCS